MKKDNILDLFPDLSQDGCIYPPACYDHGAGNFLCFFGGKMLTTGCKSDFVQVNGIRLHYLDWGGEGDPLVIIPGMGCTAYIFAEFAPRFTDHFRVLALTRRGHGDSEIPESGYDVDTLTEDLRQFLDALGIERASLVGHSMGYLELSRFAELYPQRVIKLVFLDAAYDRTAAEDKAMFAKNPIPKMVPPWPESYDSPEHFIATVRRNLPSLDTIWGPVMDEEARHTLKQSPEGRTVEKMPESVGSALNQTMATYRADYGCIQAPVLSFFAIQEGGFFLSDDYMTAEQKAEVLEWFQAVRKPHLMNHLEQFRREAPRARVVEIPDGHHYCFIKQAELVFAEMRRFLLED